MGRSPPAVVFEFAESCAGSHPQGYLRTYKGACWHRRQAEFKNGVDRRDRLRRTLARLVRSITENPRYLIEVLATRDARKDTSRNGADHGIWVWDTTASSSTGLVDLYVDDNQITNFAKAAIRANPTSAFLNGLFVSSNKIKDLCLWGWANHSRISRKNPSNASPIFCKSTFEHRNQARDARRDQCD